jgi:WD40 repeat protein
MGRPERSLHPAEGPVQRFAYELRKLRESAGRPSYRELSGRAHYSVTALSEAAGGSVFPSLAVTLAYVRACAGDVGTWEKLWQEAAGQLAPPPRAEERDGPPYLGLVRFEPDDADLFFGRGELLRDLVSRVSTMPFLGIFGASGSGKSSLLRAGLVPAFRRWPVIILTPGRRPVDELAIGISHRTGISPAALRSDIRAEPGNIELVVQRILVNSPANARVVFLIDQFEEVFTLCRDKRERECFIDCLLAMGERARVVLGTRADFYARCSEHPGLVAALRDRQVLIGPMDDDALRSMIVEPAARAGLKVETALVETVLADARGQPGALPLVSHALLETWERRRSGRLTLAAYRQAGGIQGAIAQTAERVYGEFGPRQRELVKDAFLRLTALGEGTEDTRRPLPPAELLSGPDPAAAAVVLARLTEARLVTADADNVQVAHEAVIRSWPRLRGWLADDRAFVHLRRRLTEAAAEWDRDGREEASLYRGARLAAWEGRELDRLNERELAFLTASRAQQAGQRRAARRRVRQVVAALIAVVTAVSVAAALALTQAQQARTERDLAQSRRLAADARSQADLDPELTLLLAGRAFRTAATPEAEAMLRQATLDSRQRLALRLGPGKVCGVAFSPDGRRLATSGADGTLRVWDTRTWRDPLVLHGPRTEAWSPAFSPDGGRVAAVWLDGTVRVWDLAAGAVGATVLRGHKGEVWGLAFAPDGRRLATAGQDGTVRVWRADGHPSRVLRSPTRMLGSPTRMLGVTFSPDGALLAAGGGDGVVRVWGATGDPLLLRGHGDSVEDVAFSPDGALLASASTDGTVRLWDPRGRTDPVVLRGHDGTVEGVAFSPDGRRVAGTGNDATVRIWDRTGEGEPLVLRGHGGTVWSAAFTPDGRMLASASDDGTARLWDATPPGDPLVRRGHTGAAWDVDFSPDGQRVVSGGQDGTVRVWPLDGAGEPLVLRGHHGDVPGVAFSPDGRHVAGAGVDGTVLVWNATGGAPVALRGHRGTVWNVAFSPDGRRLVSSGNDGTVRVWNADGSGRPLVLRGHTGQVRYAAYGPDGRHVASAGNDGTIRIWPLDGPGEPVVLRGHQGLVWAVAFSPDGRLVASAGNDGTVRVWQVDGTSPVRVLRGHQGLVWSLAFSPDGRQIASSGNDATVRIWPLTGGNEPVVFRGFATSVEGIGFGPGGELTTAHGDGTVRVWRCQVCGPIGKVLELADRRAIRDLTDEERLRFVP